MILTEYIDELITNNLDHNHWFMTKQTMSDYYFPFYVASIVESYPENHTIDQNFGKYYTHCFRRNQETALLYPTQCESENTYRNTIISEYLGLINNEQRQYAKAIVTDAYKAMKKYISCKNDVDLHRDIVDRQIEKIVLNVINSDKYEEVKKVTIFPTVFLYRILIELYKKYGDSKLTYEEFLIFVIRTQKYEEYRKVIDLISQYREHNYPNSYDSKIKKIIEHASSKNIRFDTLLGSIQYLDYSTKESYRIKTNQDSYNHLIKVVDSFEKSNISKETDKSVLLNFMRSDKYFSGTLENPEYTGTLNQEEFKQLIEKENDFLEKLRVLAERYGEDGTTSITSTVRLSAVQKAFRDKLLEMHGQKCMLCDVTNKELLLASHIKAAVVSDINEKADYQNGFLLCAIHDKLFDKFLITFNFRTGKIIISPELTEYEKRTFSLDPDYCLPTSILTPERKMYLMWHNEQYFKREGNS